MLILAQSPRGVHGVAEGITLPWAQDQLNWLTAHEDTPAGDEGGVYRQQQKVSYQREAEPLNWGNNEKSTESNKRADDIEICLHTVFSVITSDLTAKATHAFY